MRLLPTLMLLSCDTTTCGREACDDPGITVTFDHDAWSAGAWELTLTLPEDVLVCTMNLPVEDLDGAYCAGGRVALTYVAGQPTTAWIAGEAPETVAVLLTHTVDELSTTAVDSLIDVAFAEVFPNGPGCPPGCDTAELSITF